jgi:transposase
MEHATRHDFSPTPDRPRAGTPPSGAALPRRLHPAPLPELLASAAGHSPALIARNLGCTAASARNALRAFPAEGLACLRPKSSRPQSAKPLRALLHQSPRSLGRGRSPWTLGLLAEVCHDLGWTPRALSIESIRQAVGRLTISWRRAKHWLTSPDPASARKKKPGPA